MPQLPRNFLGGMLAADQIEQQRQASELQQVMGLASVLRQQQAAQREAQMDPMRMELMKAQVGEAQRKSAQGAQLESLISSLPPEQQALARLSPDHFVKSLLPQAPQRKVVGPGAAIVDEGGRELYRNPASEKDVRTSIEKLMDAAGITDPQQRARYIGQALNKQTTHQAPVNVYSSSMVPGVDAQGNPVFAQPSSRPDVPPRIVDNVFPAPKQAKSQGPSIVGEYEAADEILAKMISGVQKGGKFGSVGLPGVASQVYETVTGTVNPNAPSPAIDLRSDKEALLEKMKALAVRKDSNVSNKDVERYERILGLDEKLTTPGAVTRALNNVREDLRRRRINLSPEAVRRPTKEQFEVGKIYQDGSGNKAVYKGNGQWETQ